MAVIKIIYSIHAEDVDNDSATIDNDDIQFANTVNIKYFINITKIAFYRYQWISLSYLKLGISSRLKVRLNVARVKVSNTHQKTRPCESPELAETESTVLKHTGLYLQLKDRHTTDIDLFL